MNDLDLQITTQVRAAPICRHARFEPAHSRTQEICVEHELWGSRRARETSGLQATPWRGFVLRKQPMEPALPPPGLTRETRIVRDAQGRWFNEGQPLEHANLTRAFDRWVSTRRRRSLLPEKRHQLGVHHARGTAVSSCARCTSTPAARSCCCSRTTRRSRCAPTEPAAEPGRRALLRRRRREHGRALRSPRGHAARDVIGEDAQAYTSSWRAAGCGRSEVDRPAAPVAIRRQRPRNAEPTS